MDVTKEMIDVLVARAKEPYFTIPAWCKTREQRRRFIIDCANGKVEPTKP